MKPSAAIAAAGTVAGVLAMFRLALKIRTIASRNSVCRMYVSCLVDNAARIGAAHCTGH